MGHRSLPLRLYFFASFAALGVYSPFFSRWLVARGIQGVAMGAIAATLPAMGLLGPPVVGLLGDALGLRGALLRVACIGSLLAFGFLGLAGMTAHRLTFIEIFACVLVFAAFRAPMMMMADVVALERETETGSSYSGIRLWGSIGFLVASIGVGRFLQPDDPAQFPLAVAAPLAVALLCAFTFPSKSSAPRLPFADQIKKLVAAADFRLFLLAAFVAEVAISSYDLCFSLRLTDLGASSGIIGFAWAVGVVVEVALMAGAAKLMARFAVKRLLTLALLGSVLRCTLLATLGSLPAIVASQPLHAVSVGLFWLCSLHYIKARTPAQSFASAQGLLSGAAGAGSIVGMLIWGGLYRRAGSSVTFGAAAIVAAGAAAIAVVWSQRTRPFGHAAIPVEAHAHQ